MKILGTGSLSSALKWVLDVVWGLLLFGAAVLVITFAVRIVYPDMKFAPIKLSAVLEETAQLPLIQGNEAVTVDTLEAKVALKAPSRGVVLVDGLYKLVGAAMALFTLFHLRRVLASLTAGETFTRTNARRLRIIAFVWLGGFFVEAAWELWSHFYLKATVQFAWGRPEWPLPDLNELFFALVLFVIAEAARVGAALEEERALTV